MYILSIHVDSYTVYIMSCTVSRFLNMYMAVRHISVNIIKYKILYELHVCVGLRAIQSHLNNTGVQVQRYRIENDLRNRFPARQTIRASIRRRRYQVHAPLELLHIDGNHKLIRYTGNILLKI